MRIVTDIEQLRGWLEWSYKEGNNYFNNFERSWSAFRQQIENKPRLHIPAEATHWATVGSMSGEIYELKLIGEI
jgi:hypothetical protein